jgi:hypothetical protein
MENQDLDNGDSIGIALSNINSRGHSHRGDNLLTADRQENGIADARLVSVPVVTRDPAVIALVKWAPQDRSTYPIANLKRRLPSD